MDLHVIDRMRVGTRKKEIDINSLMAQGFGKARTSDTKTAGVIRRQFPAEHEDIHRKFLNKSNKTNKSNMHNEA